MPVLHQMLKESKYPEDKTEFLVNGFTHGFDLGYEGPEIRADQSENLPISVGSKTDLWNKVMKEVKNKRFAGPYLRIPFTNFTQSPIGLVPKANNQTRLIFHLSFEFKSGLGSVNSNTPKDLCSVKYKDIDHAVKTSLRLLKNRDPHHRILFYGKSDLKSAFRILGLAPKNFKWLIMKAIDPLSKITYYFADKALPFGSSRSCALFQDFSDALRHIIEFRTGALLTVTNYLDDFLFVSTAEQHCNWLVRQFLDFCGEINCPVSLEKTEWATSHMIFLGILLNGVDMRLGIPEEKRDKALRQIQWILGKNSATIKEIQSLTGFLNFLGKAIVPGRTFTRRMYTKLKQTDNEGRPLKSFHHVKISQEFKKDCTIWQTFLNNHKLNVLCRPFLDVSVFTTSEEL